MVVVTKKNKWKIYNIHLWKPVTQIYQCKIDLSEIKKYIFTVNSNEFWIQQFASFIQKINQNSPDLKKKKAGEEKNDKELLFIF